MFASLTCTLINLRKTQEHGTCILNLYHQCVLNSGTWSWKTHLWWNPHGCFNPCRSFKMQQPGGNPEDAIGAPTLDPSVAKKLTPIKWTIPLQSLQAHNQTPMRTPSKTGTQARTLSRPLNFILNENKPQHMSAPNPPPSPQCSQDTFTS